MVGVVTSYEFIYIGMMYVCDVLCVCLFFFFQAEDGIRDLVRSRGLGDVYKRQLRARLIERERLERARGLNLALAHRRVERDGVGPMLSLIPI